MSPRAARRTVVAHWPVALPAFLVLASLGLAGPARAEEDCARAVAERVQQRYDAVKDLKARFVQRSARVALGGSQAGALESSGELLLAKPGRMRWSYEKPAPSLVVSDGTTLWIYDPEAQEVQQLPLGPEFLSGAAVQFLLGAGRITDEFEVAARGCGEERAELVLTPKRDQAYERLELSADPRTGEVRHTAVVDLLGNRTEVELEDVRVNTRPSRELFHFSPPEGTRVLAVPPAP
jgi:outer membrane lipoprotein carrier protein